MGGIELVEMFPQELIDRPVGISCRFDLILRITELVDEMGRDLITRRKRLADEIDGM